MNTNLKRSFRLTALPLFVAALLFTARPARAQAVQTNRDITIENGAVRVGPGPWDPATVKNVAAHLRVLFPEANILVEPGVEKIEIADIMLHNPGTNIDDLDLALEGLSMASGRKFIVDIQGGQLAHQIAYSSVFLVLKFPAAPQVAKPDRKVAAFNLGPYFAAVTVVNTNGMSEKDAMMQLDIAKNEAHIRLDQLKEILHMTWEILNANLKAPGSTGVPGSSDTDAPTINFYQEANLLIIVGPEAYLDAARVVINALPGMNQSGNSIWPTATPPAHALRP